MPLLNKRSSFINLGYFFPLCILITVWYIIINHYFVPNVVIDNKIIDLARTTPSDIFLDQIIHVEVQYNDTNNRQLISNAEAILKGEINLPHAQAKNITLPFSANDIDKGQPDWQLAFASLRMPNILLNAYEACEREEFFIMARDMIFAWASYERSAWLPNGFLWNDHAIAARISVLIKFWKHYRNHPDYDQEVARDMFQMVARSGRLLAKPSHFTFATNHGIMQNLALLEIFLAFPFLPEADFHKQQALERLSDQMDFIMDNEGVVLEHSAAYQKNVLFLIGKIFKYLTLMNLPIPEDWRVKYKRGLYFYAQIIRPDGSLPMYGDTGSGKENDLYIFNMLNNWHAKLKSFKRVGAVKRSNGFYPVAGYSVWWNGLQKRPNENKWPSNQTVVTWSYFPGHAHKHADEMSVLIWAEGYNWWTNTGFWPYGSKGRSEAASWAGSNAPHLINEPTHSIRHTKLLSHGWSKSLAVIDLQRRGPGEYVARRQVVQVYPNLWIVLDYTTGTEKQTTTTWTTSSHINLSKGELDGSYTLEAEDINVKLTMFILTSGAAKISKLKGSFSPFAGWESNRPAPAIVVEQSSNESWAAAIWLFQESAGEIHSFNEKPFMKDWQSPDVWEIVIPVSPNMMTIWRKKNKVFLKKKTKGPSIIEKLYLVEPPPIGGELTEINTAYENAAKKYPRKSYKMYQCKKVTYLLFVIFIFQEAFFLIHRKAGLKYFSQLRAIAFICWVVLGILIYTLYL